MRAPGTLAAFLAPRRPMGKAGFAFVEYASDADRAKAEQTLNG